MNAAEALLRKMFGLTDGDGESPQDLFANQSGDPARFYHPDVVQSLFGPSGTKEMLVGRDAVLDFIAGCGAALAAREDTILSIIGVDEQCAFVHARAYRKSKATGEEIRYEWAMLYRVENGLITYGADMLDSDAQAFWGRVRGDGR